MDQSSFLVTLPSQSSLDYFPDNQPSRYSVQLSHPLTLNGRWDVGLVDFLCTGLSQNVVENFEFFVATERAASVVESEPGDLTTGIWTTPFSSPIHRPTAAAAPRRVDQAGRCLLERGSYRSVPDLCSALNKAILETVQHHPLNRTTAAMAEFSYNGQKVVFAAGGEGAAEDVALYSRRGSNVLATLGFSQLDMLQAPCIADNAPILAPFSPQVLVTCDVVGHQIYGDTMTQTLRTVPNLKGKRALSRTYARPQFVPVVKGYISSVGIELSSTPGTLLSFETGGSTLITLQFKKRGVL